MTGEFLRIMEIYLTASRMEWRTDDYWEVIWGLGREDSYILVVGIGYLFRETKEGYFE